MQQLDFKPKIQFLEINTQWLLILVEVVYGRVPQNKSPSGCFSEGLWHIPLLLSLFLRAW